MEPRTDRSDAPSNGWHECRIRVRYKDTDRMGVVYYGNYLTFFEIARAEFMRDLGFSYARLEADGYSLVVIEAAAKYHGNVGYDAVVRAQSNVVDLSRVRMRFEYRILDEEGRLLVSGHTTHACLDEKQKPVRIPAAIDQAIRERCSIP
ncbi:Thioesterase superfamily protein [uncultured Desulfatiglans sp.]|uniref:Thioesterase superfamily protein n=1 Tax=Uncultured Desulfatiglans sp. TaxID=1748965 RepID=A0A653AHE5_UNCDX|nr:Thioesterase superfamily protein [uncultured Desulfatiglans sp.]